MFSRQHREMQERRRKAREEIDSLLARGLVEKVLMWPAELGGTDDPRNVTYLPPALAERKRAFDTEVRRRVEAGDDGLYYLGDEAFTGVAVSYHKGRVCGETEYRDGMGWGTSRSWHPSGAPASE